MMRGFRPKEIAYLRKLRKAKKETKVIDGVRQKPATVKTHYRNMYVFILNLSIYFFFTEKSIFFS